MRRMGWLGLLLLVCLSARQPGAWARIPRGRVLVPESSIEHSQDRGRRAHTNHLLLVGGPADGQGPGGGMTPAEMRSFYNLPSSGGAGTIAIVDAYDYPTALSDFNYFSSYFGLPTEPSSDVTASTNQVFQVVYASGSQPSVDSGWALEEALDIEWAHALAPDAKIVLVEADSNANADLYSAVDVAGSLPNVKEVSMSWGGSEYSGETYDDSHFAQGNSIVYLAASGDNGGQVIYPAASPNVIGVGGTSVATDSSGNFLSETGWSGSGGGTSVYEPKPSYQQGIANTPATRGIPDVSSDADPSTGVSVYDSTPYQGYSGWLVVGGTSLACPCVAAEVNLDGGAADTVTELGTLYGELGSASLRDITSGTAGSFTCSTGWDFVTGVGSQLGTSAPPSNSLGIPSIEYNALVNLYNDTDGPNWTDNTGWLTSSASWYGVTVQSGHVVSLALGNNNLLGYLPSSLGDLTSLSDLDLDTNQISGAIPTELGSLTSLTNLDLDNNGLTGSIPTELGNLTSLTNLNLYYNWLSGDIPSSLGNLLNLQSLDLDSNALTGGIPSTLGNLANLTYLDLSYNLLTGSIPSDLGSVASLQEMYLDGNQLTGSIPSSLGNLTGLQILELGWNQLSGAIPSQIGSLTGLWDLDLGYNELTGSIPSEFGNLTGLQYLDLSSNDLVGEIPPSFANLTNLPYNDVSLSYNGLWSSDSGVQTLLANVEPGWQDTQTVAPTNISAAITGADAITVSWTPILYTQDPGYYQVGVSSASGGPYTFYNSSTKSDTSLTVNADTSAPEYIVVRAVTSSNANNENTVTSADSSETPAVVEPSAASVKMQGSGTQVQLVDKIVTAVLANGSYYVEDPNRASGIEVSGGTQPSLGNIVQVSGTVSVVNDEAQVSATSLVVVGQASVAPVGLSQAGLGGSALGLQPGITGAYGVNNVGLLVHVWGSVTETGSGYLYIDDGSHLQDGTTTGSQANVGVRIICDSSSYSVGEFLGVTGISSCFVTPEAQIARQLLTRSSGDIVLY